LLVTLFYCNNIGKGENNTIYRVIFAAVLFSLFSRKNKKSELNTVAKTWNTTTHRCTSCCWCPLPRI